MFESVRKHIQIAREALAQDQAAAKQKQTRAEQAFLPAAIEVMETPPSPAGRALVWCLVAFFSIALGWAWVSEVDVVASAQGKTLPRDRVKQVQAADTGVVRAIHVKNGQQVQAGDVLIELDPTIAEADVEQAAQNLLAAQTAWAQASALADYSLEGRLSYEPPADLQARDIDIQRQLINSRIAEFEATQTSLRRQREEKLAEVQSVLSELNKLSETLPLVEQQLSARKELMEKGLSSRLLFLEVKERHITHQKNLEIQTEQLAMAEAVLASLEAQAEQYRQEFRMNVVSELAEAQEQVTLYAAELDKAQRRSALQQLRAPVSGTVQQLAAHTLGGVAQAAEPLMVIVPRDGELMVEAMVLNKDIGSVRIGDPVEVKLEAFPFTKFGVIHGKLENLSLDAIEDENLGLVYAARVSLEGDNLRVDDKDIRLTSGMSVTAEINTGKRRLIEFLLSPLLRYRDEALRER